MDLFERTLNSIDDLRVRPTLSSGDAEPVELSTSDSFMTATTRGGRVLHTGNLVFKRPGKATVDGQDSVICIGAGTNLDNVTLQVTGRNSKIIIGPGCRLKSLTIKVSGSDCAVLIGMGSTWESGVVNCDSGRAIVLGDDCMLSNNILMRVSDGHGIFDATTGERLALPGDIQLHPHVWLGNGVRVGKGAEIGMGCIVGQMSLVTGTLKPHCVYGGIPAKLLRENVEWSRTFNRSDIPVAYRAPTVGASAAADQD